MNNLQPTSYYVTQEHLNCIRVYYWKHDLYLMGDVED